MGGIGSGPKSKYRHLIHAMRPGDVLYLSSAEQHRLDKQIHAIGAVDGGKFKTTNFLAVGVSNGTEADTVHRVVRIECVVPCDEVSGTKPA